MVVVAVDGIADGVAPGVGAEGVGVFALGDAEGLQESLREVGDGAGGSGLYFAADDGGDEAAEGGGEVVGGEVIAGEKVVHVIAEFFCGADAGFFFGVVGAEAGMVVEA